MSRTNAGTFKLILAALGAIVIVIFYFIGGFDVIYQKDYVTYETANGLYTVEFQGDWSNNTEESAVELSCKTPRGMNMLVIEYGESNKPETIESLSAENLIDYYATVFEMMNEDLSAIENYIVKDYDDKTVTASVYSGIDNNGIKGYTRISAVQFDDENDAVLVAVQTANDGAYQKYKDELEKITGSVSMKKRFK